MLDFELAEIYGYETKTFNQQVKNNIEKFDEDFRFQLTKDEWEFLRSKILTPKSDEGSGGRRYMPYAFTEQGIYMLMTLLKGELAVKQSKLLGLSIMNKKVKIMLLLGIIVIGIIVYQYPMQKALAQRSFTSYINKQGVVSDEIESKKIIKDWKQGGYLII